MPDILKMRYNHLELLAWVGTMLVYLVPLLFLQVLVYRSLNCTPALVRSSLVKARSPDTDRDQTLPQTSRTSRGFSLCKTQLASSRGALPLPLRAVFLKGVGWDVRRAEGYRYLEVSQKRCLPGR